MAAKKAPKRAQANRPTAESRGSTGPTTEDEAPGALVPTGQPPGTDGPAAREPSEELRRIQLLADIAGRVYGALTKWLTAERKLLRVLGVVTWLILLAVPTAFTVVLIMLVFRWNPLHTILFLGGSTTLVAGVNLVDRYLRRRG